MMNAQMLDEIASQHITELRQSAPRYHRPPAAPREQRESIRERAGWTLINVGLKLTDPPAKGHSSRPHPAGL
jgi:hypothetical protein